MVKPNAVVSVSDSNAPQIEEYGKYSNETLETFVLEDDCMTSLQLAHLKGVRHSDILRDIRKMEETWVKLGLRKFALSSYVNSQNKVQPMYKLDKKQTLYVVSKWDDELRLKIINRWEDLETSKVMPLKYSDDDGIKMLQQMIENRQRMLDLAEQQKQHAKSIFDNTERICVLEKKMDALDEITAKYESGQLSEFDYYTSSAKQIIKDIVSATNMPFQDVYHGIVEIYHTMPHYCKKTDKKSIFKVMEERKNSVELALYFYKSARMFKEKVS